MPRRRITRHRIDFDVRLNSRSTLSRLDNLGTFSSLEDISSLSQSVVIKTGVDEWESRKIRVSGRTEERSSSKPSKHLIYVHAIVFFPHRSTLLRSPCPALLLSLFPITSALTSFVSVPPLHSFILLSVTYVVRSLVNSHSVAS